MLGSHFAQRVGRRGGPETRPVYRLVAREGNVVKYIAWIGVHVGRILKRPPSYSVDGETGGENVLVALISWVRLLPSLGLCQEM